MRRIRATLLKPGNNLGHVKVAVHAYVYMLARTTDDVSSYSPSFFAAELATGPDAVVRLLKIHSACITTALLHICCIAAASLYLCCMSPTAARLERRCPCCCGISTLRCAHLARSSLLSLHACRAKQTADQRLFKRMYLWYAYTRGHPTHLQGRRHTLINAHALPLGNKPPFAPSAYTL